MTPRAKWFRCLALLSLSAPAFAASPQLGLVLPRGARRGTELDLVLQGQRLRDAREVLFYSPGIAVTRVQATGDNQVKQVKAHVVIAPDARLGEYPLRLVTETGVSELRTFWVGPYPVVENTSKERNHDFEHARKVDLNVTVAGAVPAEAVDYYRIEASKGQRITAEVVGMRLGTALFDPCVAIFAADHTELTASDDTAFAMADPVASVLAPDDGSYVIQVRDSAYAAAPQAMYLMHVGTFPRPTTTFPLGGRAGEDLALQFLGGAGDSLARTVKLPEKPASAFEVFAEQDGLIAPTPNRLRVAAFPNVFEAEPNHEIAQATPADVDVPLAFNGIVSKPGEADYFRFKGKKGEALEIRVVARALRSPLDSVLHLYDAAGRQLASNDDSGGPDSYLRFSPPADADYVLGIHDQLHRGGPEFTYRIELTRPEPALAVKIPPVQQNSQERQAIAVPRGNRFATLLRVSRTNFGGGVSIASADLPPGVSLSAEDLPPGADALPVVFEAAADAPLGGKLCDLSATSPDPKAGVRGGFTQTVELVQGPNNTTFCQTSVDKLAVAVTKEAPFTLHVAAPKVPLVQGGAMELRVTAERREGYTGPIVAHMIYNPPGVGSSPQVEIPAGKTEVAYPLSATPGAATRKWKVCVMGEANVGGGPVWAASELAELDVAPPLLAMKIPMTAVAQGGSAPLTVDVEQKEKFDGPATVKLMGLPPGVTAPDARVTAADAKVTFTVSADAKAPVGQRPSLFCQVTVMKDGERIVHNLARGGVLRVVPAAGAKKQTATAAARATAALAKEGK